ncbi:hypothetical protein E8E13_011045 [Curvularia kusanoi]|uniref:Fatty acid hydroxylase domain-containing protein n=1 Tax=Curvularia kusanoi TaxID=90978 RepID=A0A9P4TIN9_CURKU|nr:hypothetical protein E8E13_011045 [Curvularia kusanoi]
MSSQLDLGCEHVRGLLESVLQLDSSKVHVEQLQQVKAELPGRMSAKGPNPEDSVRSTWRRSDKKDWTYHHWIIDTLNIHHANLDESIPKHAKSEKIPYVKQWSHHLFVLFHALSALVVHQALVEITGYREPSRWIIGVYYFIAYQVTLAQEVRILRRLAHAYGFLDGDEHERNDIPDVGVPRAAASLFKTLGFRIIMTLLVAYNPSQTPFDAMSSPSWWVWLCVKIGAYPVVLDFWFYWYHRMMHEVPSLWRFHRKHHLIKHPVPLLSAYADDEQEFLDMVGIPLITYFTLYAFGCRLGYYDWFVVHQYVTYTEAWGHSGLRLYTTPPSTVDWLLSMFNLELTIEDHDLHHRKGWRKSHNYGKQTLLWDSVFGTSIGRIEATKDNIDTAHGVRMPLI